jgi:hypothetical protein
LNKRVALTVLVAIVLAGCASSGPALARSRPTATTVASYWTEKRLLAAQACTCKNRTTRQSATQLRFDCNGFTGGTSGSPWVTGFDPATGTGRIVGVLGGYQEGGDTQAISYSAYLGNAIRQLYDQAIA